MADYKFALKLHQDKAGSENAKAKITIGGTVVVEVQKNDDGNYYSQTVTTDDNWSSSTTSTPEVISDFTEDASFNWAEGGPKTGDDNGDDGDTALVGR